MQNMARVETRGKVSFQKFLIIKSHFQKIMYQYGTSEERITQVSAEWI